MDNNVDVSTDYFANSKQKIGSRVRVAHNCCDNKDLTRVDTKSHFARSIRAVFADIRPTKIIETGTYLGTGTTTIIARTLQSLNIRAIFYTIEVNPDFYAQAKKYIQSNKLNAIVLNGLSVPRSMLPTMEDIRKNTVTDIQYGDIFVDHKAESRTQLYYDETNFPNIDDDLLGRSLKALEYKPDFVLLDSAGHMGNIEFNYLVERLRGPCYIALDDIYHIKHHRSFKQIQNDPRFEVITASKEKFGFCIAKFTPAQVIQHGLNGRLARPNLVTGSLPTKEGCKVLIVRPDSIGDFTIFSGILHYFRKLYSNAHITLLVQKPIAELAHSCPHIDEVIPFDRNLAESDWNYLNTLIKQLRARKFDIAINPVYSRTFLDDSIVLKSDAKEKIAFIGDDTNMDIGQRLLNNTYYDRLVPATDGLLIETKRNEEFIKGLGASVDGPCVPTIWLKPEDKDYIDSLLNELGIREPIVVCPFAQAEYRQWPIHKWVDLLSHYQELPVLICGTNNDKNEADLLIDLTEHTNIHNICGKTNLRQLAALFSRSRLCIASESGTAHIAAAMDCPQVVIIGGGHFGRFMPYSSKTTLVHLPMDCYNCNWRCPFWCWEIYCITQVSVAKVDEAVHEVLANPNPPDGRPRIFKDLLKINTASIVKPLTLHIKQDKQNKTEEPSSSCWCGGALDDSVHPLYGRCVDCATLVSRRIPKKKELHEIYSLDGYWHLLMSRNNYPQLEQRAISDFADRIPVWYEVLIKHKAHPENLFEIGCAHGGFLHYCHERGVNNVVGVEVDKRVCEFAHNYFNLPNIVCGLFPDVSLPFDKFDVIVGFDVLEHFIDPVQALKKVATLLTDDGLCFFQIPRYRGEGEEWAHFRPEEHIYLFNNESIQQLFEAADLDIRDLSPGYYVDDLFIIASRSKAAKNSVFPDNKSIRKKINDVLVTAIVSTYNSEDSIAHCLQDLEEQTIADKLEIIVINSGSQQNEESIVKAFQQKYKNIKYIRTENRETIYKAWNRAIRMASGKYITNANTDDSHRKDALEILMRTLDENPDAVLAYANQGCVDKVDGKPVREFIAGPYSRYRMLAEWCYISSHPMWRKDVHKEFGYFNETFVAAGDWEFWLRISQKYDFVYINEILGNRLWTEDCLSRNEFEQEDGLSIIEAELIRKCYHYALETAMVIDYRAISANPTFSSWPEVSLWKQKVQAKLSGAIFNPENNIKNILDYRDKSTPRLSIVIVSYNNLSALQTNLSSLNEQTEDRFEVIVVNSGQIIPEPDWVAEQLKYGFCCVELKQNLGPSSAKNIGIKQARGEYVAFLDDDAIAEKNFAKHILRHFSNLEIYGLRGKVLPKDGVQLRHITPEFDLGEKIIFSACEVGTNCAFRKDILDRVGGFNENLFGYEFQELSYRIFKVNDEKIDSIIYLPDVIVHHNPPTKNLPYYVNQLQRRIGKKIVAYKRPGIENYLEFARIQYPHRQEKIEKDYKRLLNIGLFLHKRYPQEAVKWLEKAMALNPDEITSCHTLGSLYLRLERYNEAQVILEKILGPLEAALVNGDSPLSDVKFNNPSEIAYYFVSTCTKLAQCYIKQGKYDKIKQVYTNLLNNPDLPILPELKSNIFNVLKKLDKTPPATVIVKKQNNIATSTAKTENDCLVSAIVSTYNCEKFIRGCLEDLENQTIAERLEIIVVDSGSEENEESIVREFQQKYNNIKYIRTEHREGIYTAWNKAIKLAQSRFITNANTDDRHRKDALEVMAKELLANPDIALVYTDQIQTDTPNESFDNHHGTEILQRPDYSRQRLLFGCCVGSQPMWRKSLHDEFGYFDESLTSAGDWDFWLRISSKYKFKHIHESCGLYYYNKNGIEHGRKIHSLYERYIVGRRYGQPYIAVIPIYQNKDNPLVSFIMPAYNAGKYIADAIESVLIQNYRNFELIVVDDGSTDNTKEVVLQYSDDHIKYIYKENGGVSGARNLAITQSKGRYIIPLDADDMMAPNLITLHLQEFEKHPDADLVYCDVLLIDVDGKPIRVEKKPEYQNHRYLIRDLFQQGHPIIPFRLGIRRSVFDRIGLYDETLVVAEDYDMMRRFIRAGLKEHHLRETLHLRRMHPESLSRAMNPDISRSHFEVIKRFTDTFGYDELFPDIMWDKIAPEKRQLHAKCLIGATYLTIGQSYIKSNSPIYANQALDMACSELNDCLKSDPDNQLLRELLQKSELLRAKYSQIVQQAVEYSIAKR